MILPLRLRHRNGVSSLLSTVMKFGSARDVTLSELSIETLYPAGKHTAEVFGTQLWLDALTAC